MVAGLQRLQRSASVDVTSCLKIQTELKKPEPKPYTNAQVREQLEALVAEKSALAQENARLHRENTNLQELLSYTVQQRPAGEIVDCFCCNACENLTNRCASLCASAPVLLCCRSAMSARGEGSPANSRIS